MTRQSDTCLKLSIFDAPVSNQKLNALTHKSQISSATHSAFRTNCYIVEAGGERLDIYAIHIFYEGIAIAYFRYGRTTCWKRFMLDPELPYK